MVVVIDGRTGVQETCMASKAKAAPKEKEKELAHDRQQTVVTNQPTSSNSDASSAGN